MPDHSGETSLLDDLNDQQRIAATYLDGPLLILAGAGSGKTRVITYRLAYLIHKQICSPNRILAVTFTNKAAQEMRSRVVSLLPDLKSPPLISTFHAFGARFLRRYIDRLNFGRDFAICDRDDQTRMLKTVAKELDLGDDVPPIPAIRAAIGSAKNKSWTPDQYLKQSRDAEAPIIFKFFKAYQRALRASNAVDFDDLLLLPLKLFRDDAELRERFGGLFQHLLIDEYQDTNAPQYELIRRLSVQRQNVCAVGDEDQSIYGFRGADIGNILRFESDFRGAKLVKLEQNYRSTQVILDGACAVVAKNSKRKGKVLWTSRKRGSEIELFVARDAKAEALYVVERIDEYRQGSTKRAAVLYRTNAQSREFEEALNRKRIPYRVVGGVGFYSRKEVKDAIAYLRVARNPSDNIALLRIINVPARGIGRKTLDRLQVLGREFEGDLWRALRHSLQENVFPGRTHRALDRFLELVQQSRQHLESPLHLALDRILETSGYRDALIKEETHEAEERLANLEELINAARDAIEAGTTFQEFLDDVSLRSDSDDYDENAAVTLMTLHNAKGLEFPVVFLAGFEEGLFPHSRAVLDGDIEEERRLCYVGMTRAEERLHISYSRQRRFYGQSSGVSLNEPSRFLNEIPSQLIDQYSHPFLSPAPVPEPVPAWTNRSGRAPFQGTTYNSKESVQKFLDKIPNQHAAGKRIAKGALVEHGDLGLGRVLNVETTPNDQKITVKFFDHGIKKMIQSYAKLKIR